MFFIPVIYPELVGSPACRYKREVFDIHICPIMQIKENIIFFRELIAYVEVFDV